MNQHPVIIRIEALRSAELYFEFTAFMDCPSGEFSCKVSIDALVDYVQFQKEVLAMTGVFYRFYMCEGREPVHCNELWKEYIASFLKVAKIETAACVQPVN